MKIIDVVLKVLEDPDNRRGRGHEIVRVPGLRRIQYTHKGRQRGETKRLRQNFIEVHTDQGLMGRCTTTMNVDQADIVRYHAVGRSPWEREGLFQRLLIMVMRIVNQYDVGAVQTQSCKTLIKRTADAIGAKVKYDFVVAH